MQSIANKSLILFCAMFSLVASKSMPMQVVMQKIHRMHCEQKIKVTVETIGNRNQGAFKIVGGQYEAEYQIQRLEVCSKNRVQITTFNKTLTQKKTKFYVKYLQKEGKKFLAWLSECSNKGHIACTDDFIINYSENTRNSLKLEMYMRKGTGKQLRKIILNFNEHTKTLKNLVVKMPTPENPQKYYTGWGPEEETEVTSVHSPSRHTTIDGVEYTSFILEATCKKGTNEGKKYVRRMYLTSANDESMFDNAIILVKALYKFAPILFDGEQSWNSRAMRNMFELPMKPKKKSAGATIAARLNSNSTDYVA